jgi:iron complex transport system substrate-binding protein
VQRYFSSLGLRALLFVACLCFFGIGGARAQATAAGTAAAPAMHEVTDEVGRTVRVPVNPTRIISLAPSLTETIYALHAEDRLVGDTLYCDYPADAQKKPKVGGVINPNFEEIAALHPDLVLMTKGANRLETVRALDTLGIPSYATNPRTVDEIISSTQKLADVLNLPAEGKAVAEDMQRRLEALRLKLSAVPPKRVFFIVWLEPLQSIGRDTFIADALRKAGAVSIVESNQDWPKVNFEAVAQLQPEYLVFAPSHADAAGHEYESLANRPGWKILEAVRNRRFVIVSDAINRPAPRIVSVIEDLAHQLHPDIFMQEPVQRQMQSQPFAALRDDVETEGGRTLMLHIGAEDKAGKMPALPMGNSECVEESPCVR